MSFDGREPRAVQDLVRVGVADARAGCAGRSSARLSVRFSSAGARRRPRGRTRAPRARPGRARRARPRRARACSEARFFVLASVSSSVPCSKSKRRVPDLAPAIAAACVAPVEAARDHQVEDQEELVVELEHDALAEPAHAEHARGRGPPRAAGRRCAAATGRRRARARSSRPDAVRARGARRRRVTSGSSGTRGACASARSRRLAFARAQRLLEGPRARQRLPRASIRASSTSRLTPARGARAVRPPHRGRRGRRARAARRRAPRTSACASTTRTAARRRSRATGCASSRASCTRRGAPAARASRSTTQGGVVEIELALDARGRRVARTRRDGARELPAGGSAVQPRVPRAGRRPIRVGALRAALHGRVGRQLRTAWSSAQAGATGRRSASCASSDRALETHPWFPRRVNVQLARAARAPRARRCWCGSAAPARRRPRDRRRARPPARACAWDRLQSPSSCDAGRRARLGEPSRGRSLTWGVGAASPSGRIRALSSEAPGICTNFASCGPSPAAPPD